MEFEMFNLAEHVKTYDGMLVFGDVHSDYDQFAAALDFATKENYFFMGLGDLVDRGEHPYEVVAAMHKRMYDGHAGFVIGNHDNKFFRYRNGAKVRFSMDGRGTLEKVGPERMDEFLRMYAEIQTFTGQAGMFHKFDNIYLVHAASHPDMWDPKGKFGSSFTSRALYGEVTGEVHPDGYPIRYYNWIEEIPMGKTVIVGHDRKPIHQVAIEEPLVKTNANGGKAIFIDTGCGKGGFLTGALILHGKKDFYIDSYRTFK
jgi:protein phosphatase